MVRDRLLDHIVINVQTKLDEAEDAFRLLGFTVTERGHHTIGTSNHLSIFQEHYLELLGTELGRPAPQTDFSSGPMGVSALALKVRDCEQLYRELTRRGLPAQQPQSFSRPVKLAAGTSDAKFTILRLGPTPLEGIQVFFCQHLTPQLVWRPEWQQHRNGAFRISHLIIAASDPMHVAEIFGQLAAEHTVRRTPAGCEILSGGCRIEVLKPSQLGERIQVEVPVAAGASARVVAIGLQTRSVGAAIDILSQAKIPGIHSGNGRLMVPASQAMGVALEFTN